MTTNIINLVNIGAGVYAVQFSAPITWDLAAGPDYNFMLYSPGDGGWWPTDILSKTAADTVHISQDGAADIDCDRVMLTAQPLHLTAALPFAIAAPIFPA